LLFWPTICRMIFAFLQLTNSNHESVLWILIILTFFIQMQPINTSAPASRSLLRDIAIVGGFFGAPLALAALFYLGRRLFIYVCGVIRAAGIRIPTAPYPPGGVVYAPESAYTTCPICLEDFTVGEDVAVLQCTHLVHPGCVKNQVKHFYTRCAICNGDLVWPWVTSH
jgi:hypothetical protein